VAGKACTTGPALLGRRVTAVRARVTEPLATYAAHKRLLTRMNARVLFEVVLELERLAAVRTTKASQFGSLTGVTHHVTLQSVDIRECFTTHTTRL